MNRAKTVVSLIPFVLIDTVYALEMAFYIFVWEPLTRNTGSYVHVF